MEDKYLTFPTIDALQKHMSQLENKPTEFDDIATRYCVLRNENLNIYIIFFDNDTVQQYLQKNND